MIEHNINTELTDEQLEHCKQMAEDHKDDFRSYKAAREYFEASMEQGVINSFCSQAF